MQIKCLMEIKNPNDFRIGKKYILSNKFLEEGKTIEALSIWEVMDIDEEKIYYHEVSEEGVINKGTYYKSNLISESFKRMYKIEEVEKPFELKSIEDYTHPNEESKVVDFKKRKEEKESKEEKIESTRYDFKFNEIDYKLNLDFYFNGITCTYVHDVVKQIGPIHMHGQCKHNEQFFELTKWDKFLNFLGADICVTDKVEKALPKYKEETLKSLERERVLQDEEKRLHNRIK